MVFLVLFAFLKNEQSIKVTAAYDKIKKDVEGADTSLLNTNKKAKSKGKTFKEESVDNDYYLNHDIKRNVKISGWVFMDYRNNSNDLDRNNIIYGHNMLNESMFGSLKKVLSSSWRKKDGSMIINYDTPSKSYKFQIFSAYKVNYTTDYLKTDFLDNDDPTKLVISRQNISGEALSKFLFENNDFKPFDIIIPTLENITDYLSANLFNIWVNAKLLWENICRQVGTILITSHFKAEIDES